MKDILIYVLLFIFVSITGFYFFNIDTIFEFSKIHFEKYKNVIIYFPVALSLLVFIISYGMKKLRYGFIALTLGLIYIAFNQKIAIQNTHFFVLMQTVFINFFLFRYLFVIRNRNAALISGLILVGAEISGLWYVNQNYLIEISNFIGKLNFTSSGNLKYEIFALNSSLLLLFSFIFLFVNNKNNDFYKVFFISSLVFIFGAYNIEYFKEISVDVKQFLFLSSFSLALFCMFPVLSLAGQEMFIYKADKNKAKKDKLGIGNNTPVLVYLDVFAKVPDFHENWKKKNKLILSTNIVKEIEKSDMDDEDKKNASNSVIKLDSEKATFIMPIGSLTPKSLDIDNPKHVFLSIAAKLIRNSYKPVLLTFDEELIEAAQKEKIRVGELSEFIK